MNTTAKRKRDVNDDDGVDLSLLEEIEKSQKSVEAVDIKTLKKLVLSFERRLTDNLAARLKYPEQPEKFADSEIELHEEIEKLKILAGAPELYPDLVNLNTIPPLLDLLSHDNTDIAVDVVGLLQDLTDEDVFDEPDEILVDCLIENNVLESLVQNLLRLSESDPDEAVAMYKSRDPKSLDEEEMVENLFDCLCCMLMPLENKEKFLKAEGVELMIIIIMNQKKLCYGRALDFAMTD